MAHDQFMKELSEAVNLAITEDPKVKALIDKKKAEGFDLMIILEATITLQPDKMTAPGKDDSSIPSDGRLRLTDMDKAFLKSMKFDVSKLD